ncbi:MAG: Rrf2 family transcriptional regulator [Thermoleophilia bacterium]|nr:Rrf2 family transcriptional regulator [Thermoleophilia bacterium]
MINVSDRSRVAVLALMELASRGGTAPVPILDVAECREFPAHQVEQVFAALRRAGVLHSQRGVKGGYTLGRPPADISVLEVVEAVDGPIAAGAGDRDCAVAELWAEGAARLGDVFAQVSIADMVEREARRAEAPMFHI